MRPWESFAADLIDIVLYLTGFCVLVSVAVVIAAIVATVWSLGAWVRAKWRK